MAYNPNPKAAERAARDAQFARQQQLKALFKKGQPLTNRGFGQDYSVDFEAGILCWHLSPELANYYAWEDASYCAVEVDDKTIVEASTASIIGRGLVGGVLLGGVGALLGGLTASKTSTRHIKKVTLKLTFASDKPGFVRDINLYRPGYFSGPTADEAIAQAERIHTAVSLAAQAKAAHSPATSAPGSSLADQLGALSALHKAGALSDAQFEQAKAKLL